MSIRIVSAIVSVLGYLIKLVYSSRSAGSPIVPPSSYSNCGIVVVATHSSHCVTYTFLRREKRKGYKGEQFNNIATIY
uniref:Secreted protein n=1 Tax=Steinernema glaseri TaxID=37863 RepID=A0A1I7YFM0_9BILA